ncbi:pilus assembly protein TadG-related protein [Gulosibacter faecalis]|jgi:uncharacterized membrane protein|uniref:Pilus assembly protein TadG-related protein n=1 Tax=Gulosibacter faecalis TaxID=272240 RepID=A0ABW5UZ20_9MICO|nr:pilus assembly protein TadG-related protein [Gulosibacter faecalis]
MIRSRHADDRGSITPLAIIYAVVALLLATVLAAAGHLYLERKQLLELADGAALAAADSYDLDAVHATDGGLDVRLDPDQAVAAATAYVERFGSDSAHVISVEVAGDAVIVTVATTWAAPVVNDVIPASVELTATATARTRLE